MKLRYKLFLLHIALTILLYYSIPITHSLITDPEDGVLLSIWNIFVAVGITMNLYLIFIPLWLMVILVGKIKSNQELIIGGLLVLATTLLVSILFFWP